MFSRAILYASIVVFFVSLALPAFTFGTSNVYPGFGVLIVGPLGILSGCFVWLANPLLILSWSACFKRNHKKGLKYSVVSILIALTLFLYDRLLEGSRGFSLYTRGSGYYLWLVSILISLCANFCGNIYENKEKISKDND